MPCLPRGSEQVCGRTCESLSSERLRARSDNSELLRSSRAEELAKAPVKTSASLSHPSHLAGTRHVQSSSRRQVAPMATAWPFMHVQISRHLQSRLLGILGDRLPVHVLQCSLHITSEQRGLQYRMNPRPPGRCARRTPPGRLAKVRNVRMPSREYTSFENDFSQKLTPH